MVESHNKIVVQLVEFRRKTKQNKTKNKQRPLAALGNNIQ